MVDKIPEAIAEVMPDRISGISPAKIKKKTANFLEKFLEKREKIVLEGIPEDIAKGI